LPFPFKKPDLLVRSSFSFLFHGSSPSFSLSPPSKLSPSSSLFLQCVCGSLIFLSQPQCRIFPVPSASSVLCPHVFPSLIFPVVGFSPVKSHPLHVGFPPPFLFHICPSSRLWRPLSSSQESDAKASFFFGPAVLLLPPFFSSPLVSSRTSSQTTLLAAVRWCNFEYMEFFPLCVFVIFFFYLNPPEVNLVFSPGVLFFFLVPQRFSPVAIFFFFFFLGVLFFPPAAPGIRSFDQYTFR